MGNQGEPCWTAVLQPSGTRTTTETQALWNTPPLSLAAFSWSWLLLWTFQFFKCIDHHTQAQLLALQTDNDWGSGYHSPRGLKGLGDKLWQSSSLALLPAVPAVKKLYYRPADCGHAFPNAQSQSDPTENYTDHSMRSTASNSWTLTKDQIFIHSKMGFIQYMFLFCKKSFTIQWTYKG